MARRDNIGLRALADVASIDEAPTTYHAGFILGPRVNAGGRVGEASLGARLLTTEDLDEARDLALRLDAWNKERRELEAACLDEAIGKPKIVDCAMAWSMFLPIIGMRGLLVSSRVD